MDNLLLGKSDPPLEVRLPWRCPAPSAHWPWKTFQTKTATIPTASQKLAAFGSERVSAFSLEPWPVSNRNGGRLRPDSPNYIPDQHWIVLSLRPQGCHLWENTTTPVTSTWIMSWTITQMLRLDDPAPEFSSPRTSFPQMPVSRRHTDSRGCWASSPAVPIQVGRLYDRLAHHLPTLSPSLRRSSLIKTYRDQV